MSLRMLALIGLCAALGAPAARAGNVDVQYGFVSRGHDGHRSGDRRHRDRGVIVIDRYGERWRGEVRRLGDREVVVIDPRLHDRFGHDRRPEWGHRHFGHTGSGGQYGFRGHALSPQQRLRLWVR